MVTLDCEGCEGGAIQGGTRWLSGSIPGAPGPCVVCMETNEQSKVPAHLDSSAMCEKMESLGFIAVRDTSSAWGSPKGQGEICFVRKALSECAAQFQRLHGT